MSPPKLSKKDKDLQEQQPAITVKTTAAPAKTTKPKVDNPIELPTAGIVYFHYTNRWRGHQKGESPRTVTGFIYITVFLLYYRLWIFTANDVSTA